MNKGNECEQKHKANRGSGERSWRRKLGMQIRLLNLCIIQGLGAWKFPEGVLGYLGDEGRAWCRQEAMAVGLQAHSHLPGSSWLI